MPRFTRLRRAFAVPVILAILVGLPAGFVLAGGQTFSDVPPSHLFYNDIEAVAAAGVTSGCTATTYCPNANVTRGQMAAFMNRLGALGSDKTPVVRAASTDGWSLGCPANTTWSQGLCFENTTRDPLSVYGAADACASVGFIGGHRYRLPTIHQLRSARAVLTIDVGGEHTDSLFSEWDGDSNSTMSFSVFDNGTLEHIIGGTDRRFRCVTPPMSLDFFLVLPEQQAQYPDAVAPDPNGTDANGAPTD